MGMNGVESSDSGLTYSMIREGLSVERDAFVSARARRSPRGRVCALVFARAHQGNHVFSFRAFFTSRKYKKSQYEKALPTYKKKSPLLFGLLSTCILLFFFTFCM